MHRTICIELIHLNCHEYVLFMMVFPLLGQLALGSDFLAFPQLDICLKWLSLVYCIQQWLCSEIKECGGLIQSGLLSKRNKLFRLFFMCIALVSEAPGCYTLDSVHESNYQYHYILIVNCLNSNIIYDDIICTAVNGDRLQFMWMPIKYVW